MIRRYSFLVIFGLLVSSLGWWEHNLLDSGTSALAQGNPGPAVSLARDPAQEAPQRMEPQQLDLVIEPILVSDKDSSSEGRLF